MKNQPEDERRLAEERERQRERAHIREFPEAIEKLGQALEAVTPRAEVEQLLAAHAERMKDEEFRELFEGTTQEERAALVDDTLAWLEEKRAELGETKFEGTSVDEMIADLKAKRERVAKVEALKEQTDEWGYQIQADLAQIDARRFLQVARGVKVLQSLTEEQWSAIPLEDRMPLLDLLANWRGGLGERCLSQLPIEVRQELEGDA